jgi:hypothetical protein
MSLNNSNDVFAGKRYIALVRASNDTDGTNITEAQLGWMHDEGRRLGMQQVDDEVLSGVTGSLPGRREDVARLLRRRAEQRDFDVLLVQRCDWLSLGGAHALIHPRGQLSRPHGPFRRGRHPGRRQHPGDDRVRWRLVFQGHRGFDTTPDRAAEELVRRE